MALHFESASRSTLIGLNPAWLPLPGVASWLFGPAAKLAAKPGAVAEWMARTGSTLDAQGLDLYTRVLSDSGHVHGVLSMMAAWRLKPLAARLHEVRNPVFMHIGTQDQTVPPTLAEEACRYLPQARMGTAPGLGHLAHEQDPTGTAQQILQWCAVR
jgi:magnesium chelatase accessory protein